MGASPPPSGYVPRTPPEHEHGRTRTQPNTEIQNTPEHEHGRTQGNRTRLCSAVFRGPCVLLCSACCCVLILRSFCVPGCLRSLCSAFCCVLDPAFCCVLQSLRSAFSAFCVPCVLRALRSVFAAFCCVLGSCVPLRSAFAGSPQNTWGGGVWFCLSCLC